MSHLRRREMFVAVPPGNFKRRDLAAADMGLGMPTENAFIDHGAPIELVS